MRLAITTWNGRISPVFDVAKRLLLVELDRGAELGCHEVPIEEAEVAARASHVLSLGVDTLICGAISRPLEQILASAGVNVVPRTCGPVEEVLRAFTSGQLTEQAFLMPGCRGRRRFRGRRARRGARRQRSEGELT